MVDKLSTRDLDRIYRRLESVVDVRKITQKQILDFLTSRRPHYLTGKMVTLRKTKGMRGLSKLIKGLINIDKITEYERVGKKITAHLRTRTTWTKQEENYIKENPKTPLRDLAIKFGKTYDSVRTKRQRILKIRRK